MIAVDTNILVYSHREDTPWFEPARECVRSLAEGAEPWAIPWPCVYEFLAVVTHPRVFAKPTPLSAALDQVHAWLESPAVALLAEAGDGRGFWGLLAKQLATARVTGPVVHDARVAALCMSHGVAELWSADRDFGRFQGLKVRNPLVGAGP
ncbi:MAG: PIN domain-containing protein [Thermoleophilia bacterium]|nr:PIN domain-containing protein [Thermoleophilia bacterium]